MPLLKAWNSDPYSLAAIWHIEEPEPFFTGGTGLTVPDIKNEKRRIERLAGRFLLKYLQADFPLHGILPDAHDKPRIPGNQYFFSISHSWPYVAAVISPYMEAGIDIQCWHPRMGALARKFLSPEELDMVGSDERLLTLAWCAKEAAYKWQGKRGVDFIEHLPLIRFASHGSKGKNFDIEIKLQLTNPLRLIQLDGIVSDGFAMSFVHNSTNILNLELT